MSDFTLFALLVLALAAFIIVSSGVTACVMAMKMGNDPSEAERKAFEAMLAVFKNGAGAVVSLLAKISGRRNGRD